jgi:hypothetical protein
VDLIAPVRLVPRGLVSPAGLACTAATFCTTANFKAAFPHNTAGPHTCVQFVCPGAVMIQPSEFHVLVAALPTDNASLQNLWFSLVMQRAHLPMKIILPSMLSVPKYSLTASVLTIFAEHALDAATN